MRRCCSEQIYPQQHDSVAEGRWCCWEGKADEGPCLVTHSQYIAVNLIKKWASHKTRQQFDRGSPQWGENTAKQIRNYKNDRQNIPPVSLLCTGGVTRKKG